jgi:hypothetical protein
VKKFLFVVPLCAALVSGCENVKSTSSPTGPTSTETTSPTEQPAPPPVYPSTGPEIVAYVVAHYPERLVGGIPLAERMDNMRFLRDRMIEIGLCGGVQLGWNLKRGGPEISNDFLAWRTGGGDMGVDIGFDYDNTSEPLRLQWLEAGYSATYKEYPAPDCH